jgi:hypothetical protein
MDCNPEEEAGTRLQTNILSPVEHVATEAIISFVVYILGFTSDRARLMTTLNQNYRLLSKGTDFMEQIWATFHHQFFSALRIPKNGEALCRKTKNVW